MLGAAICYRFYVRQAPFRGMNRHALCSDDARRDCEIRHNVRVRGTDL